jgi:hypothetical protein
MTPGRTHIGLAATLMILALLTAALGGPAGAAAPTGFDWVVAAGSPLWDEGHDVAVDGAGNAYVTGGYGYYGGAPATFGAGQANETTLEPAGDTDAFLASYDRSGGLLWAQAIHSEYSVGNGVAVDSAGNVYVTGYFWGSATFGTGQPGEITLVSAGARDMFLAAYDHRGRLRWARRAGGPGMDGGGYTKVGVDGLGNVYVTGDYDEGATFGEGEAGETTLSSEGGGDVFVASYSRDGTLRWARGAGGIFYDRGSALAVDAAGNVAIAGFVQSRTTSMTWGLGEPNETTIRSAGYTDVFVASFDRDGALQWARRIGSADGADFAYGLARDATGNVFVTGFFYGIDGDGVATFGEGDPTETTLIAGRHPSTDLYLASYDRDGVLRWARQAGTTEPHGAAGFGVAVDGAGNTYVTGLFTGAVTFGAGDAAETTLHSAGGQDVLVASYDRDGVLRWADRAGGPGEADAEAGFAITLSPAGDLYLTGRFAGDATFGAGTASEATIQAGSDDYAVFLARYQVRPSAR